MLLFRLLRLQDVFLLSKTSLENCNNIRGVSDDSITAYAEHANK